MAAKAVVMMALMVQEMALLAQEVVPPIQAVPRHRRGARVLRRYLSAVKNIRLGSVRKLTRK